MGWWRLAIERVAWKRVQKVRMTDVHGRSRRRRQGNGERGMNFFIFFNLVTSRTSSGAVDGAVESAMAGKLRTKKEKVMMTKVDG